MTATGTLARVYVGVVVATGAVALVVLVGLAAPARGFLDFTFPGVPATAAEAGSIFLANLQIMLVAFAGCFVHQWPWLQGDGAPGRVWRVARRFADAGVCALVVLNVVVVGSSIGGYGTRMVRAVLPHAPVELLAFSAALTLYLLSRRRRLEARAVSALGGGAVVALAAGAGLEAFGASAG